MDQHYSLSNAIWNTSLFIIRAFTYFLFLCSCIPAYSQLTLSGTSYFESFDDVGSGLPTGWSVRTGANNSSLGTSAIFNSSQSTWASNTGEFRNCASTDGLSSSSIVSEQNASTDRVIALRQTGTFGDPGAAFTLEIANTTNLQNFNLFFNHLTLDEEERTTTFTVQFTTDATGTTGWTNLGTYSTNVWGSTNANYAIPSSFNNVSNTVWIRIVALSAASGSNSRDTYGMDDFQLTWGLLPIELIKFTGKLKASKVFLEWETASEKDNSHFFIEHSIDGKSYNKAGRLNGKGNTSKAQDYNFIHDSPSPGLNYYRLKQVDFDGSFSYSPVISVFFEGEQKGEIEIYPTSVRNALTVVFPEEPEDETEAIIFDTSGKVWKKWLPEEKSKTQTLPVEDLMPGMYFLKVLTGSEYQTARFVKL